MGSRCAAGVCAVAASQNSSASTTGHTLDGSPGAYVQLGWRTTFPRGPSAMSVAMYGPPGVSLTACTTSEFVIQEAPAPWGEPPMSEAFI